ncbi:MAG: hypothetical protein U5K69_03955 [Balneolaceae bacterium]|nr:hypothetical protein [Balneolaceae bacterium]
MSIELRKIHVPSLLQKATVKLFTSSSTEIRVKYERSEEEQLAYFDEGIKKYDLTKFERTNQDTTINQKPIVMSVTEVVEGRDSC